MTIIPTSASPELKLFFFSTIGRQFPSICAPQCLHTLASFKIGSAHCGHFPWVAESTALGSFFKEGRAATTRANGPKRQPRINHPQPSRSLPLAIIMATNPKRSQIIMNSINRSQYYLFLFIGARITLIKFPFCFRIAGIPLVFCFHFHPTPQRTARLSSKFSYPLETYFLKAPAFAFRH